MNWEDEGFEVPAVTPSAAKWELEDQEEPVKESWEDESDKPKEKPKTQKKDTESNSSKKGVAKKGKISNSSTTIEETLEDPLMEKQRQQLIIEQSDFENTTSMFSGLSTELKIDTGNPKDARDFEALAEMLSKN